MEAASVAVHLDLKGEEMAGLDHSIAPSPEALRSSLELAHLADQVAAAAELSHQYCEWEAN